MIQILNEYNPLEAISRLRGIRSAYVYDEIRKELFKGGVVFESDDEFNKALVLLINMDII